MRQNRSSTLGTWCQTNRSGCRRTPGRRTNAEPGREVVLAAATDGGQRSGGNLYSLPPKWNGDRSRLRGSGRCGWSIGLSQFGSAIAVNPQPSRLRAQSLLRSGTFSARCSNGPGTRSTEPGDVQGCSAGQTVFGGTARHRKAQPGSVGAAVEKRGRVHVERVAGIVGRIDKRNSSNGTEK